MIDLMSPDQQLAHLRDDADRLATVAEHVDLSAPIAACPGWDVHQLLGHVGFIHRWAAQAVTHGAPPAAGTIAEMNSTANGGEIGAWLRSGSTALIEALAATSPDANTWHPFPIERKAWVWTRRQMLETAVHRWDAEVAASGASTLTPEVAAVGLAEYFDLGLPHVLARRKLDPPTPSLHVHCTDDGLTSGEWIVWNDNGEYRMEAEHRKGDAALRGQAADLLLVLMGRADRTCLEIVGDPSAAAAWLDLPGW
jgi:uncharacterized protein (TIGR03083 family)